MVYNMKISQKEETITRDEMHHLHLAMGRQQD